MRKEDTLTTHYVIVQLGHGAIDGDSDRTAKTHSEDNETEEQDEVVVSSAKVEEDGNSADSCSEEDRVSVQENKDDGTND